MQNLNRSEPVVPPDPPPEATPPPPPPAVSAPGSGLSPPSVQPPSGSATPRAGAASFCANHPDRPAMAMCMACRKRICQNCSTEWDGIHHCVDCLASRRQQNTAERPLLSWLLLLLSLAALYATLHGTRVLVAQIWGALS